MCRDLPETDEAPTIPAAPEHDSAWIALTLAGDKTAYGRLYDRYAPLVRAVCHDATRDLHEAQDLCQEVFLRAYSRLGDLRQTDRFSAWLLGIARLVCREWCRKSSRTRRLWWSKAAQVDTSTEPARRPAFEQDADTAQILAEIARLPDRERMAIHLFYLQEHPIEDAQKTMRLSRSGFYRVLDRARRRLKRALEPGEALFP